MAGPNLSARIGLDGEQEFRQAIKEINGDLSVTRSEMRKVTAQYKDNADSIEALTAKGEVLAKELVDQQHKVETTRAALDHANKTYGEGSEEAIKWTKALNNAEAQVYNTESAIRKNNEALEEAKNGMQGAEEETQSFGDVLDVVGDKLGIKLPKDLTKAADNVGHFSLKSVAAVAAVTGAVVGLEKAYEKLFDLTKEAAANADNILTLSQITGLDTDTIQEMQYAAELIDVSFDTIKGSLTKLKNNMQDARDGNDKLTESFRKLGVQITNEDGTLRDAEAVFYDVIDALGKVENATERDTIAMDLFGRSAEQLNPLILQGSDRLRELADEAHEVGYVMSDETLAALGEVDDEVQRMHNQFDALKNQIAAQFAPAAVAGMQIFSNAVTAAGNALLDSGIIKWLGDAVQGFGKLIGLYDEFKNKTRADGVIDMGSGGGGWVKGSDGLYHSAGYGWNLPNAVYDTSTGLWYNSETGNYYYADDKTIDTETGRAKTGLLYDSESDRWYDLVNHEWYGDITQTAAERYGRFGTGKGRNYFNASGNMNFVGGRTWVGENGPEEVELPAGTRIYNAQETAQRGGGDVFIFNIDAKNVRELNQLVAMAESARLERRMR